MGKIYTPGSLVKITALDNTRLVGAESRTSNGQLPPGEYWGESGEERTLWLFLNGKMVHVNLFELLGEVSVQGFSFLNEERSVFLFFAEKHKLCRNEYCYGRQTAPGKLELFLDQKVLGEIDLNSIWETPLIIKEAKRKIVI